MFPFLENLSTIFGIVIMCHIFKNSFKQQYILTILWLLYDTHTIVVNFQMVDCFSNSIVNISLKSRQTH